MSSSWIGRPQLSERPRRKIVSSYRAIIAANVVQSTVAIAPDANFEVAVEAIARPPEWHPFPWPQMTPVTNEELLRLSLLKLLTVFEFESDLGGETGDEIRSKLLALHPGLAEIEGSATSKQLIVDAAVYDDGYFDGGFDHPADGEPLPLRDETWETLELYVKNMVRADIRDRLAQGNGGHWTDR